jgi:hypothetical protein
MGSGIQKIFGEIGRVDDGIIISLEHDSLHGFGIHVRTILGLKKLVSYEPFVFGFDKIRPELPGRAVDIDIGTDITADARFPERDKIRRQELEYTVISPRD